MRNVSLLLMALLLAGLAPTTYGQAEFDPLEVAGELSQIAPETPDPPDPPPIPIRTIAKGDHSRWQRENPDFAGADFIIRDPHAWTAFWSGHAPPQAPPPPPVDFHRHVVVVAIQGLQPTGRGPTISIVDVRPAGPMVEIVVIDDERRGPEPIVTNPFHIVAVERGLLSPERSVSFLHLRPLRETGVVVGRVFAAPPQGQPQPLPDAHVVLARQGSEPLHAMTGMDGSYFFVNVVPGEYVLRAEAPGFEPVEEPVGVPPNVRVDRDFHLRPLPPGVIEGRVLGAEPQLPPFPLPDSLVQLFRHEVEIDRRRTGPEGEFVFEQVLPGPYRVVASHEGFEPQDFLAEVEPGGVVHHVFVLRPAAPPGAFEGFVLGRLPNGRKVPLGDALVRLMGPHGEVARARTDNRGHFAMPEVPPGRFLATAEAVGWRPGEAEVEIRSGQVTRHAFVLCKPTGLAATADTDNAEVEGGSNSLSEP